MALINNQLPVQFEEPASKPVLVVHRFRVHRVSHQYFIENNKAGKQLKLRVFGSGNEVFEIRVYYDDDGLIETVRTYHYRDADGEMIDYIVRAIVKFLCSKKSYVKKVDYKNTEIWRRKG